MKITRGQKIFNVFNYAFMVLVGLICVLPFINLLAVSLSGQFAVNSNAVTFWPVDFTVKSYEFVLQNAAFARSLLVTLQRVILGVSVNMILIILTAYPLSKSRSKFKSRTIYAWFFIITILLDPGLVPWFMTVRNTGLIDSIWALILPDAVPVFSMIVLMNFMRGLPGELEEAASIDGAGHLRTLTRVILPVCIPSLATVALFAIVAHWNAWFDGMLFMNRTEHYPLQTYLQTVVVNPEVLLSSGRSGSSAVRELMNFVSVRSTKAAQLFIGTLPILLIYPFLQRYFTTGLVMGSVKG